MKKLSLTIVLCLACLACISPTGVHASSNLNVTINGKAVAFTENTGYPYIDGNGRTMVPLRVTMEATGAAVGYDSINRVAIVITEHDRIEVPIGESILYNNNVEIQNDTVAVINNGKTYLPIRAVLESADFNVEWDNKTKTVNAYTFQFDANEFVPYSTSNLQTLISNVLKGNVVYVNGQYYTTPKYVKLLTNVEINYSGSDLNIAIYPQAGRYSADTEIHVEKTTTDAEWLDEADLSKMRVYFSKGAIINEYKDNNAWSFTEASAVDGIVSQLYVIKDMTDDFAKKDNATTVIFSEIQMKKVNGKFYFNQNDLISKEIIEK